MLLFARSPISSAPASFAALRRTAGRLGRVCVPFAGLPRLALAFACAGAPAFADSEDGCIPSPEDGIFCGEDPDTGPSWDIRYYNIYGDESQEWDASLYRVVDDDYPSTYLAPGARLSVSAVGNAVYTGLLYGEGALRILSGTVRFLPGGTHTATLGFAYLYSSNSYSGGTEIAGGKLIIGGDSGLGLGTVQLTGAGVLETWFSGTLRGFSITGDDTLLSVPNQWITVSGTISGDGRLNLAASNGQITLTAVNTHTHGTSMSAGKLIIGDDSALGAAGTRLSLTDGATLAASASFASTARELALGAGTQTIQVGAGDSVQWNGVVTGAGTLEKTGAGTLTLAGADSTFSGGLLVSAGTVRLGADQSAGAASGSLTIDGTLDLNGHSQTTAALSGTGSIIGHGGTLTLDSGASTTLALALTGAGNFTKAGAGTLTLAGANALFAGTTTVAGGTLRLTHSDALANSTLVNTASGTVAFGSLTTVTIGGLGGSGSLVLANENEEAIALVAGGNNASTTFSGALSGAGSLAKTGSGTLTLSGAITLTGATLVSGGTLRAGAANVLGADSALFVVDGATVDLAGHDQSVGDLDSYDAAHDTFDAGTVALGGATLTTLTRVTNNWAGAITGEGNIIKEGAATARWSGANTFAGTLTVAAGTLLAAADGTLSRDAVVSVSSGATLDLDDHAQTVAGLAGAGTVTLGSASLTLAQDSDQTFSGALSGTGALTKSGAGTLTLAGANGFSGGLTLSGGAVSVASDASLGEASGSLTFDGGTLATTAAFASARDIALAGAGTIRTTGGTLTLSGALSGPGSLTKTGSATLVVAGNNTGFTGATTIAAGTLTLGHASALGQSGAVSIASGAILDSAAHGFDLARVSGAGTLTGSGAFSHDSVSNRSLATILAGTAGLTKSGSGTLTLTGASTYTGTTTVAAGRLVVDGSIAASALTTVNAGATLAGHGTLGALTIASGATLAPGDSPGTLSAGDTTFAGGATFQFELNNATGAAGTNWDLLAVNGTLTLSATSGNPFTLDLTSLTSGNATGLAANFDATSDYSFTFLTTTAGVSGFSSDAFAIATSHFSNPFSGTWSVSLTNSGRDLSLNYAGSASAIPEPSTYAALAGIAALGLAAWRRRPRAV